jgi:hypothetical protein
VMAAAAGASAITVRTESYPHPPYSGATYYLYERDGQVLCTKLEVCNKYRQCTATYRRGRFIDDQHRQLGPHARTAPVAISPAKLGQHVCLSRFGLAGQPSSYSASTR